MTESKVGVVEIGSNGIRLLVAELRSGGDLQPIHTAQHQFDLMGVVDAAESEVLAHLSQVNDITGNLLNEARELDVSRVQAFGTEAIRKIEARFPGVVAKNLPDVMVLDAKQEAYCSFLAAVKGRRRNLSAGDNFVVLDFGAGSLEVVTAEFDGNAFQVGGNVSYPWGHEILMTEFRKRKGAIQEVFADMRERFTASDVPTVPADAEAIIMGRVITNLTWVIYGPENSSYHPQAVHNKEWYTKELADLFRSVMRQKDALAAFKKATSNKYPSSPTEWIRLIGGMFVLEYFLKRLDRERFFVSASGTRYGMAWMLYEQHE